MQDSELVFAFFLILAALVTGLARIFGRWYISMPMIFVFAGILFGPQVADILVVSPSSENIQLLAELTLAMLLFADASTLNVRRISEDISLPGRLLGIALPLIIILGGILGKLLFPELPVGYVLLVAAILAPTDAALGLPIYTNPLMPVRIRRALNIESGLNDGIVSPFVILFLGVTLTEETVFLGDWVSDALIELGLAVLIGAAVGYAAGVFLKTAVSRKWTTEMWSKLSILTVALACFFLSVAVGGNGFVAAFIGGLVFGQASNHKLAEQTEFAEGAGTLMSMLVWTVFAAIYISPAVLDWAMTYGGRAILYALLSLTVVRMLPVALSMIGTGLRLDTVLLMGWFGPRGLASVVFGLLATAGFQEAGLSVEPLATIVTLTVLFSIFAHGLSAQLLVNWYAGRLDRAEEAEVELAEVEELPIRTGLMGLTSQPPD
ncbi:MAG: cation:proton antiporter [Candidatus Promineifilaceae bacterium]